MLRSPDVGPSEAWPKSALGRAPCCCTCGFHLLCLPQGRAVKDFSAVC